MRLLRIKYFPFLFISVLFYMLGCKNEDPTPENIPELITKVILTFSPVGGGPLITVTATDPDGGGVQDLLVDGPINLSKHSEYNLSLQLINELYLPGDEEYDITSEIKEEADEHQLFFGFSDGLFSSPSGSGNILMDATTPAGNINYSDTDDNDLPLGLETFWFTTDAAESSKYFRVILKHQPEIKSLTSTSLDGETDLDISFVINVID